MSTTANTITYRIDPADRIVEVGGDWDGFARANRGDAVLGERVIGSVILDHFSGPEVVEIMRSLFDRVRERGSSLSIPFRCDSPDRMRELELTMTPLPGGGIDFRSVIVREVPHTTPATLLDADAPRSEKTLTLCAWCRRVRTTEWVELDEAIRRLHLLGVVPLPQLSHAICPACEARLLDPPERRAG